MNYKSIFTSLTLIILCVIALFTTFLLWPRSSGFDNEGKIDRKQYPHGQEMRQQWKLAPGAQVNVTDIAGRVTIETHEADTAELVVERAANQPERLQQMSLQVTPSADAAAQPINWLSVSNPKWRAQRNHQSRFLRRLGFGQTPGYRERVVLKLPRQVSLSLMDIQGDVSIGEVEGIVRVSNTRGNVRIAKATEAPQLLGIKGSVEATLTRLGNGMQVGGISGPVKLHFLEEPDARIRADLVLGAVRTPLPGFRLTKRRFWRYEGQTKTGDKLLLITSINDSVTVDCVSAPQLAQTPVSR